MYLSLSHGLYGRRRSSHKDAYRRAPGLYFVELGAWTLELDLHAPGPLQALLRRLP